MPIYKKMRLRRATGAFLDHDSPLVFGQIGREGGGQSVGYLLISFLSHAILNLENHGGTLLEFPVLTFAPVLTLRLATYVCTELGTPNTKVSTFSLSTRWPS